MWVATVDSWRDPIHCDGEELEGEVRRSTRRPRKRGSHARVGSRSKQRRQTDQLEAGVSDSLWLMPHSHLQETFASISNMFSVLKFHWICIYVYLILTSYINICFYFWFFCFWLALSRFYSFACGLIASTRRFVSVLTNIVHCLFFSGDVLYVMFQSTTAFFFATLTLLDVSYLTYSINLHDIASYLTSVLHDVIRSTTRCTITCARRCSATTATVCICRTTPKWRERGTSARVTWVHC